MASKYEAAVKELSPGAYAIATGAQIWIQNDKNLCISKAYAFRISGARAEMYAWRDAFFKLEKQEQAALKKMTNREKVLARIAAVMEEMDTLSCELYALVAPKPKELDEATEAFWEDLKANSETLVEPKTTLGRYYLALDVLAQRELLEGLKRSNENGGA